ncbi:MAG: hypothetical protein JWP38_1794 [Herbaspirillum sp.]|jgi:hypothetical protein|nr:hypothetical protein [Herbaspirillum sp.]
MTIFLTQKCQEKPQYAICSRHCHVVVRTSPGLFRL